jgi:death-on-curing protein
VKVITKEQALLMHRELIAAHGGSGGVRDEGLLDSALSAPFQTFDGKAMLPSIQQKAARLCYGLVMNHPFADGNKRAGAHIMLTFLAMNGIELEYTQKELYETILSVAAGELSADGLLQWIIGHEA